MREDLDKWVDLWEKAQKDGVFEDAPKPPQPTPLTSDPSFFGPIDARHTSDPKDCDVQYWNDIYSMSQGEAPEMLNEEKKEAPKAALKKSVEAIAKSPNPIRPSSVGTDQELTPGAMGLTFSEKDIEQLADLKLQLHDLTSKMASFIGEGKEAKQLENKIASLKKRIDEFSDELARSLGEKKSIQGVEISADGQF